MQQFHLSRDKRLSYGGVNNIFTILRSSLNERKHDEESHMRIREEEEKLIFDSMPSISGRGTLVYLLSLVRIRELNII